MTSSHQLCRQCPPPPAVLLDRKTVLEEFAYLAGEAIRAPRFYGPCLYLSVSCNEIVALRGGSVDLCVSVDEESVAKLVDLIPNILHAEAVGHKQQHQPLQLVKPPLTAVPIDELPSIEFIIDSIEHASSKELRAATSSLRPVARGGGGMWSHTDDNAWVWTFQSGTTLSEALLQLHSWNKNLAETPFVYRTTRLVHFDHHSLFGTQRGVPLAEHAIAATCRLCVPVESLHLHSVAFSIAAATDTTHLVTDAVLRWRTLGVEGEAARVEVLRHLLHWGAANRNALPFTDACWLHIVLALTPVAFSCLHEAMDAFFRSLVRFRWANRVLAVDPQTLLVHPRSRTTSLGTAFLTALVSVFDISTARSTTQENLGIHRCTQLPITDLELDEFHAAVCSVFGWDPAPAVGPVGTVPCTAAHVGLVSASELPATSTLAEIQRNLAHANRDHQQCCSCSLFNVAAVDRESVIFALPGHRPTPPGEIDHDATLWQLQDYRNVIASFPHRDLTYAAVDENTLRNTGTIGMAVLFHDDDTMTREDQESHLRAIYRQVFCVEPPRSRWDSELDTQKKWAQVTLP